MPKVAIGADHGGYHLKNELLEFFKADTNYSFLDLSGPVLNEEDDYTDFAKAVATKVQKKEADKGVIICGSGVGASIAANKFKGVRASVCHDIYSASQGVRHDDMNVLCLGGRIVDVALARELVTAFLSAKFEKKERFVRRLNKVLDFENEN